LSPRMHWWLTGIGLSAAKNMRSRVLY